MRFNTRQKGLTRRSDRRVLQIEGMGLTTALTWLGSAQWMDFQVTPTVLCNVLIPINFQDVWGGHEYIYCGSHSCAIVVAVGFHLPKDQR